MAPKQLLDRSAWQWAETTNPESVTEKHIRTAYRLELKPCKPGKCRRNCKSNPHCLIGLGERGWFVEIDDRYWYDVDDPSQEYRREGELAGLRNLGATCYLNTLLQLWFHNLTLRSAILKVEEPPIKTDQRDANSDLPVVSSAEQAEAIMPTSACGHLQLIFALLQYSKRRYIDPTPFINCLGLDAAQQQDAQEFSKLFLSLLEDTLQHQQDSDIRNLVQRQFMGVYSYVTVCSACGSGSQHTTTFYELDLNIKGHKNLYECIDEFIEEEKLEDDNQYMCASCNRKQNAVRRIQLQSLPPVLNVQLLRFIFDRVSGVKKKLNTYIQFPEVLDMSQYLGQKEGSTVYDLYAVLIHCGPSAYSGHYVAHIRDQKTNVWYKFNDEQIEKMGSKNLTLCKEDEMDQSTRNGEKKPKTPKGAHCSRNAYMLVYCQRRGDKVPEVPEFNALPQYLQQCLEMDNQKFDKWIKGIEKRRDDNVARGHARQADVKDIYSVLPVTTEDEWEWIPTQWLKDWLGGDGKGSIPKVDIMPLLCQHQRMNPHKVNMAKCISSKAADLIYEKFKGKQRLKGKESLCHDCVIERCRSIRRRTRINEDSKLIGQLLKDQASDSSGYWVGKLSLRSWRRLALEEMEENPKAQEGSGTSAGSENIAASNNDLSDISSEDPAVVSKTAEKSLNPSGEQNEILSDESDDKDELQFNEDVLCYEHGNLVIDESCRRLVPADIWNRLKLYFPNAPEFPAETQPCCYCKAKREKDQQARASLKMIASEQKVLLSDLYFGKNRPAFNGETHMLWVTTRHFLDEWRKFIRDPVRNEPPAIINRTMLCPHDGFTLQPDSIATGNSYGIEFLRFNEWQNLVNYISFDVEIIISRIVEENDKVTFLVQPDLCMECTKKREQYELTSRLTYTKATVFVRKITSDDITPAESFTKVSGNGVKPSSGSQDENATDMLHDDKQQEQRNKPVKRKIDCDPSVLEKVARVESGRRRSPRYRRIRGEKSITVSSTMTLRDLKLEIMKQFTVAPFDQHLLLEGKELTGDKETLASLQVFPESTLYLKVDEPMEDPTFLEDVKGGVTEEGFKGTSLLGR